MFLLRPHLLIPTALAMRSLRSQVLILGANMILEKRGREGKAEGGVKGRRLASKHGQTTFMEYTMDS